MITTNYLHQPKHSNSSMVFGNGVNFTGKNHLITPTNTNMQCSLGNENLALLDKIRLIGKANGQEIYLVGGAVRDCLLGKEPHDLDIMVNGDALEFSRILQNADDTTFTRVILKDKVKRSVIFTNQRVRIDVVPLCDDGKEVKDKNKLKQARLKNAKKRDFSINTMFIQLGEDKNGNLKLKLIDSIGVKKDLRNNKLVASKDSISIVEAMRGVRFKIKYGMNVDKKTDIMIREKIRNLKLENRYTCLRLYYEFKNIFRLDNNVFDTITTLAKYKTFSSLILTRIYPIVKKLLK